MCQHRRKRLLFDLHEETVQVMCRDCLVLTEPRPTGLGAYAQWLRDRKLERLVEGGSPCPPN